MEESAYDLKFQEMKMYIPFLEDMIQRLESTSPTAINPRQAQLNKIRSLRDLLLDKKKRMKMENLLKCEQVLINLYAKVELQRDGLSGKKPSTEKKEVRKENSDLEAVRNKLKTVVKMQEAEDTLPEIARASQIEEVCTPGSKEPALFQRRPNKSSLSPQKVVNINQDITKPGTSRPVPAPTAKRNYTRVLLSPEPSVRRRPPSESTPEQPLFSRRSPRRSPKRKSLTFPKKERKKFSKESKHKSNFNITLNVPEESLESLNTEDILSRIINLPADDVEIDTLRGLRSQILEELKQTGSNEDISDLILKPYGEETPKSRPNDVEEGELSDSESELIGKVYDGLPVPDKKQAKQKARKGEKRKIQICLVINSDKDNSKNATIKPIENFDLTQDDAYHEDESTKANVISLDSDETSSPTKQDRAIGKVNQVDKNVAKPSSSTEIPTKPLVITIDDDENVTKTPAKPSGDNHPNVYNEDTSTKATESTLTKPTNSTLTKTTECIPTKSSESTLPKPTESTLTKPSVSTLTKPAKSPVKLAAPMKIDSPLKMNEVVMKTPEKNSAQSDSFDFLPTLKQLEQSDRVAEETVKTKFVANFYKPLNPNDDEKEQSTCVDKNVKKDIVVDKLSEPKTFASVAKTPASVDKPAEHKKPADVSDKHSLREPATVVKTPEKTPKNVSEIDILQALKNEILSESLPIASSEVGTPALHQPKITKVSSAKEILPKKRISIEKYKQKSVTSSKNKQLFINQRTDDLRDKKQSIKLTEKECERFKLPTRLSLDEDDISDDALSLDGTITGDDVYSDLAPKSPDIENFTDSGTSTPVIIPTDPVKTVVTSSVADVDMRKILPPQPVPPPEVMPLPAPPFPPLLNPDVPSIEPTINRVIADPRIRKDLAQPKASPNQYGVNPEGTPRPVQFPNISPLLTPSYTPSYTPSTPLLMTPNARSFEMTPTRQPFEMTPSRQPFEMTPSRKPFEMTPSRQPFEMTPSRKPFELEEPSNKKHVYAPSFSPFDRETSVPRTFSNQDEDLTSHRDEMPWDDRNIRATSAQRDSYRYDKQDQRHDKYQESRQDKYSDRRDRYHDQRYEKFPEQRYDQRHDSRYEKYQNQSRDRYHSEQKNDQFHVDRREYSAMDCPTTPIPSFGWSECPGTPRRQDPPMTPSHPFGRSECPTTPSHIFGRSECPNTPSHPFGRSECPNTPSHPFGRSECPTTPIHSFGRSDARPEQLNTAFRKDPRLNRRTDLDPSPNATERERVFHPDHRYESGSKYNANYAKDGHKSRYYDRGRREPSLGRSISRDSEGDSCFYPNNPEKRDNRSSSTLNEPWSRRNYRENSVGRSMYAESSHNLRATSVGRNTGSYDNRDRDNRMSIKSKSGRSFTIDTSVNSSFCKLIESGKGVKVFDYSFTDRRQRAASVGRSLVRENSVNRQIDTVVTNREYDNSRIKRASSVGRDLLKSDKNKSLRDLKAEFQSFRDRIMLKMPTSSAKQKILNYPSNSKVKQNTYKTDHHSRKDDFNQHSRKTNDSSKQLYSPRSNYRDPRMRREQRDYQNKSRSGNDSRDRRQHGIVYSNDNIAKGTIISPGFGVKNYKIPKIKRPDPEPELQPEVVPTKLTVQEVKVKPTIEKPNEKSLQKTLKPVKKEQTVLKAEKVPKKGNEKKPISKKTIETGKNNESTDEEEKRVTRSSRRSESTVPPKPIELKTTKERKAKRRVISDSESELDELTAKNELKSSKTNSSKAKPKSKLETAVTSSKSDESVNDKDSVLDSSFGMDDLTMFSENIVNDPVIDNINALIADLDHDLDSKSVSPTEIENIMESINDPEENILGDISEVIENDLKESKILKDSSKTSENLDKTFDALKNDTTDKSAEQDLLQMNNENIVSTTDPSYDNLKLCEDTRNVTTNKKDNIESIPDSTINKITLKPGQGSPDSTNESYNESSTIVTSTHDNESNNKEDSSQPSSSRKDVDSLDSLLSILQNKAKLKELLSRLDDTSSESDKIKKKLEKLSAIVSDDEDSNEKVENESNKKGAEELTSSIKDNSETQKENESAKSGLKNLSSNAMDVDQTEVTKSEHVNTSPTEPPKETKTVESQYKHLESDNKSIDVENHKKEVAIIQATSSDKLLDDTKIEDSEIVSKTESSLEKDSEVKNDKPEKKSESKETLVNEMNNQEHDNLAVIPKTGKKKRKRVKRRGKKMTGRKNDVVISPTTGADQQTKKVISRKTRNRELKSLQDDINEMSIRDDILNATGIRMCRLAKIGEDKSENTNEESVIQDGGPVVVLEKFKVDNPDNIPLKIRKKPGPKPKPKKDNIENVDKSLSSTDKPKSKSKPGPKSKQTHEHSDPYEFDTDSIANTSTTKDSDDDDSSFDDQSLASSRSFGSSEILADVKKKVRRKRGAWQTGVIKPRNKKKKEQKPDVDVDEKVPTKPVTIPDYNCFTDKTYCFKKNTTTYDCRLCYYSGDNIVKHYRKEHPHTEIPLSRIEKREARVAIEQCEEINFQAISKLASDKYTCRFCNKEFNHRKQVLESFFWHVVSAHTGEYKQACYSCVTETRCPFNLDIPPPPKELQKQLIGYICGKCNFTQISLENLKTHVIVRHNDEQTEVYTINLSALSRRAITLMLRRSKATDEPRTLRSTRSNQSNTEASDDASNVAGSELSEDRPPSPILGDNYVSPFKSKIFFESDDHSLSSVKLENDDRDDATDFGFADHPDTEEPIDEARTSSRFTTDEIVDCAHFRIYYTESGTKEYVCCINDNMHYKTALLISIKKHVQTKHADEPWDGYCTPCKVIVTPQGVRSTFKDCLTHYFSKHIDDFPVAETLRAPLVEKPVVERPVAPVEKPTTPDEKLPEAVEKHPTPVEKPPTPKPYLAIRPLAELIAKKLTVDKSSQPAPAQEEALPVIENVVSLGHSPASTPIPTPPPVTATPVTYPAVSVTPVMYPVASTTPVAYPAAPATPTYPSVEETPTPKLPFEYEEVQADVMSKKHRIVLDAMMTKEALIRVFKCAGRFCSFTTDSTEDALLHASTHQRVGGEDALRCAYCNFDASGNAIDLVMHVFKEHKRCQFACGQCFYRSIASRLVAAHFAKVHANSGKPLSVLRNATAPAVSIDNNKDLLTREQAVPFYVCQYAEGSCKYRSYIPGKFVEHVDLKHASADKHPCYRCDTSLSSTPELIEHLKTHGLRLYQCTWCVHGASNESELITHMATKHPAHLPQAYLRIITNKEGSKDLRVLPLAYLYKSNVTTEDVTPSSFKENPVKEAERSIDLEKLIGDTNMLVNSISTTENETSEVPVPEIVVPEETAEVTKSVTPPPPPIVKTETKTPPKEVPPEIICLDSDDETESTDKTPQKAPAPAPQPSPEKAPSYKKINEGLLLKCPFCSVAIYKSKAGLMNHTRSCKLKTSEIIVCPHSPCTEVLDDMTALMKHYELDHCITRKHISMCQICNERFGQHHTVKLHLREAHGVTKFRLSAKVQSDGTCLYTFGEQIDEPNQQHQPPKASISKGVKRKTSTERRSSIERPKRFAADTPKKYGINDIDKLPINPILDSPVFCDLCGYNTKVRLNMIRHLQLHAENQSVPSSEPVNPVPHLETNEKHFDKMVNLASSSVVTRAPEKAKDKDVSVLIPVQDASQYPQYVSERQRLTCGARGCSYISVDEGMLRCHWDTLHAGTTDYLCVHCPPHQHLDTSKPLTASHIITHLKMHDVALYACSHCLYYHYKRQAVEKHLSEHHRGGQVKVVREEAPATTTQSAVAPTMDLKPYQCGSCQFKSLLRQEVVEHCAKIHQSKMQFKCGYCPFRTSAIENVTKHQTNSHPGKPEDIFYYYYKEGSIPDEDGIPKWRKQMQKMAPTEVKSEPEVDPSIPSAPQAPTQPLLRPTTVTVDLNIVKHEVNEDNQELLSIEELCKKYGQFCPPNGIKYRCCLCSVAMEHTRDNMQSHLFEELKYRRWSCGVCPYKAYHLNGLNEHMAQEHSRQKVEPTQLPIDHSIEKWVSSFLDQQTAIIEKNKAEFAKQKIVMEKPVPVVAKVVEAPKPSNVNSNLNLEQAFGDFGAPINDLYSCPKCNFNAKEETDMRNHLESELTKIRWCCSNCALKFQTYHEAQFHCKSVHTGQPTRPVEAIRDPAVRSSWVTAVIASQKQRKRATEVATPEKADSEENSLLKVRYAETANLDEQGFVTRKRPADSDDDFEPKKQNERTCPYCSYKHKFPATLKEHVLKHYNLKPFTCGHCDFDNNRRLVLLHMESVHPNLPRRVRPTKIPDVLPSAYNQQLQQAQQNQQQQQLQQAKQQQQQTKTALQQKICLICEKSFSPQETESHVHGTEKPEFGLSGDTVLKCDLCHRLLSSLTVLKEHYQKLHPNTELKYVKLLLKDVFGLTCLYCDKKFKQIFHLVTHHNAVHPNLRMNFSQEGEGAKGSETIKGPAKRVARKSTTKLPYQTVAKKSTTKLPMTYYESDSEEEYSFYGTKPLQFDCYKHVTTQMPMFNTMVDIDVKKLSGLLNINPRVVVRDVNKK